MKANYENNPEILKGKERAKKYEEFKNASETEDWQEVKSGTELNPGVTMYEMAKQGAAVAPALTGDQIENFKKAMISFIDNHPGRYYMLLCNDRRDYTLFDKNGRLSDLSTRITEDILDCVKNRECHIVDYEDQQDAFEIWIKDSTEDAAAYYFFPYDRGVITYY